MPDILLNLLGKSDLLIVFVGMAYLLAQTNRSLHTVLSDMTRLLAGQPPATLKPAAVLASQIAPAPVSPPPAVLPAPTAADPAPWMKGAMAQIGFRETGDNHGIDRFIAMAHCGANGDPWCAIFANAMLEQAGVPGTRSASSQSFRSHPGFVKIEAPSRGAIAVFWRGQQGSGLGHVGFYWGEDDTRVWTLGGNENDMVQIEALPKASERFGLIGYWWPTGVAVPTTGPAIMPAGSATRMQSAPGNAPAPAAVPAPRARQTTIVATMFGNGEPSAYGGQVDDAKPGVALPFRFAGERPRVRVIKGARFVDCDIVDVGPWNTNDPYWETGARPQAETGTDGRGRRTNRAGIDLTFAAATAVQLDGKGLVDWEFIDQPQPKVS
ncbi:MULTISPECIES: TIGR02594 family protein [unclassified Bradyrhizobium]|uniref:TIGR02594 family protein n=1 Tax=unclassified Bradyrhizobium TaxID=2631580 RepID=UPI0029160FFD|nr:MULTISPECIES: TIGR02594 family protein [unclassified Bradyrhizobium]